MARKNIPTKDETLEALQDHLETIYEAFEVGTDSSRLFFEAPDHPFNSYLFSHHTRYIAYQRLTNSDIKTIYKTDTLANIGIQIGVFEYNIRIRRAPINILPKPGTYRLKSYYWQNQQLFLPFNGKEVVVKHNLVLTWFTTTSHILSGIQLYYPTSPTTHRWDAFIQHPAKQARPEITYKLGDTGTGNLPLEVEGEEEESADTGA